MAPPPEYDKEPKAPDKSATNNSCEEPKTLHNLMNDQQTNTDNKIANSTACGEGEKHVEALDDGQLRALLDEAITYKCPKDREGKSSLFKELLEEVEQDEQACEAAARGTTARARRQGRGRRALPHSNSLQDLVAALAAEPAPRRVRHQPSHAPVSARAIHGGSLPSGVDTSFLLGEEPPRAGYLATVRCVNPPPLAERRVSASDANCPAEVELLNRRSKTVFPMTYTARATLEIGSGPVCSGRALTTTTSSNQVRTRTTRPLLYTSHPHNRHYRDKSIDQANTNRYSHGRDSTINRVNTNAQSSQNRLRAQSHGYNRVDDYMGYVGLSSHGCDSRSHFDQNNTVDNYAQKTQCHGFNRGDDYTRYYRDDFPHHMRNNWYTDSLNSEFERCRDGTDFDNSYRRQDRTYEGTYGGRMMDFDFGEVPYTPVTVGPPERLYAKPKSFGYKTIWKTGKFLPKDPTQKFKDTPKDPAQKFESVVNNNTAQRAKKMPKDKNINAVPNVITPSDLTVKEKFPTDLHKTSDPNQLKLLVAQKNTDKKAKNIPKNKNINTVPKVTEQIKKPEPKEDEATSLDLPVKEKLPTDQDKASDPNQLKLTRAYKNRAKKARKTNHKKINAVQKVIGKINKNEPEKDESTSAVLTEKEKLSTVQVKAIDPNQMKLLRALMICGDDESVGGGTNDCDRSEIVLTRGPSEEKVSNKEICVDNVKSDDTHLRVEDNRNLRAEENRHLNAEDSRNLRAEDNQNANVEDNRHLRAEDNRNLRAEENRPLNTEDNRNLRVEGNRSLNVEDNRHSRAEDNRNLSAESQLWMENVNSWYRSLNTFQDPFSTNQFDLSAHEGNATNVTSNNISNRNIGTGQISYNKKEELLSSKTASKPFPFLYPSHMKQKYNETEVYRNIPYLQKPCSNIFTNEVTESAGNFLDDFYDTDDSDLYDLRKEYRERVGRLAITSFNPPNVRKMTIGKPINFENYEKPKTNKKYNSNQTSDDEEEDKKTDDNKSDSKSDDNSDHNSDDSKTSDEDGSNGESNDGNSERNSDANNPDEQNNDDKTDKQHDDKSNLDRDEKSNQDSNDDRPDGSGDENNSVKRDTFDGNKSDENTEDIKCKETSTTNKDDDKKFSSLNKADIENSQNVVPSQVLLSNHDTNNGESFIPDQDFCNRHVNEEQSSLHSSQHRYDKNLDEESHGLLDDDKTNNNSLGALPDVNITVSKPYGDSIEAHEDQSIAKNENKLQFDLNLDSTTTNEYEFLIEKSYNISDDEQSKCNTNYEDQNSISHEDQHKVCNENTKVKTVNNTVPESKHESIHKTNDKEYDPFDENPVSKSDNIIRLLDDVANPPTLESKTETKIVLKVNGTVNEQNSQIILAGFPNNSYVFLTYPKSFTPLQSNHFLSQYFAAYIPEDKASAKKYEVEILNTNPLKQLLFRSLFKSDSENVVKTADKEVDSAIPFSCITTPEVVASCNTTSSTSQAAVAVDPKPRSVISSSFNGLPLSRPNYGSTASSAPEEYKKSLDENGNSVQGFSSPLSGSSHKKPRRKKSSKNETVIKSHQIDGYQGNKDLNEVLRFIESNADNTRQKLGRAKHKDDSDDKKKRSTERRKDKESKIKRATSMEELSRTKLEDLTDKPAKERESKPERRSWGDDARDSFYYETGDVPDTDFQTVTKKRKPRRRADEPPPPRAPSPRARRVSAPPSDRSNDSNDDLDSVHSLPADARPARAAVSYADIARTRHNIPDLIESCNYYPEAAPAPDPDHYPALEPPPRPRDKPAPATLPDPDPHPDTRLALHKEQEALERSVRVREGEGPAPDVVADRRPPVILLDSSQPRDMDGVTFGFDINEQLLGTSRRPRCDLVRSALEGAGVAGGAAGVAGGAVAMAGGAGVTVGCGLRYVPPRRTPLSHHTHLIVDYVTAAWEDVVRCGAGKVRYFSE